MDWRAEITNETRQKFVKSIFAVLKERWSACRSDAMDLKQITNLAIAHEKKLLKNAKSKEQYLNALTRNPGESSSSQDCPAFCSDQSVVIRRKERALESQPSSQMTNQPHQWAAHNSRNQQPAGPNPLLQQRIQHLESQEVIGEDFHALTFLHQNHSAIEHHKQHQSVEVSAVSNGNPNAEDWHDMALLQVQRFRTYLPLLNKAYETTSEQCLLVGQIGQKKKYEYQKNMLKKIIYFLKLPGDKIKSYTKQRFYQCVQLIVKTLKSLENGNINLANKQQPLHGQPSLSQSHINPVQQSHNVNPHFQQVNLATTGSYDSSSPIVPREIGSLRSEGNWIQKYRQHPKNIKQELQSPCIQQNQKSKENIQPINRSGMYLDYQLNSKFSHPTHEAKQLSQIAGRALPTEPHAISYGRASPIPSPSLIGLGKNSSNVSYLSNPKCQFLQGCNSLKFNPKTEIQVQSHEIRSSSTTCHLGEPTSLGSNEQLSTATQPSNRLLKAIETISTEAFRAAVSEIISVGDMEDRITDPWCLGMATRSSLQDGCGSSNNMKRKINATLNDMPLPCSDIDGSEPTVTPSKKLKKLSDKALLEEMRNINKLFVETVLELDTDENVIRRFAKAGTVIRCSYRAATESKSLVFRSANTLKLPVLSLKLLVPLDYPEAYPVFLTKFETDCGTKDEESREMSSTATSKLHALIRTAPDHLSLEDYAKGWDKCARAVVSEHAQRAGGGCFSSRYGTWEDCVTTT